MAIRIDAAGDLLRRSTDLPSVTMTCMGWVYLVSDRNNFGILFDLLNNVASVYQLCYLGADGTTLNVGTNAANASGTNLSLTTWYHIALTRSGDVHTVYLNGVQDAQVTSAVSFTPAFLVIGSDGTNYADIRVANIKVWSGVALTADEIKNEMWFSMPQRTNSIHMVTPLLTNNRTIDYSGNARDWTEIGTLTNEDSPGITWQARPKSNIIKYAAPQNSSMNVAGASSNGLALTTNFIQTINNATSNAVGNQLTVSVGGINSTVNKSDSSGVGLALSTNYIQSINNSVASGVGYDLTFNPGGINSSVNLADSSAIGNNLTTHYVQSLSQALSEAIGYQVDRLTGNVNASINLADSSAVGYTLDTFLGTAVDVNKSDSSATGYNVGFSAGNVNVNPNVSVSTAIGYPVNFTVGSIIVTVNYALSNAQGNVVSIGTFQLILSPDRTYKVLADDRVYEVINDNRILNLLEENRVIKGKEN